MDIRVNDELLMKKPHPCGGDRFLVLRVGMDFKLRCLNCSHEVMLPRKKAEKNIKSVFRNAKQVSREDLDVGKKEENQTAGSQLTDRG